MNHVFFKPLLFLSAGSVIHGMLNELDMRKMGRLASLFSLTYPKDSLVLDSTTDMNSLLSVEKTFFFLLLWCHPVARVDALFLVCLMRKGLVQLHPKKGYLTTNPERMACDNDFSTKLYL